MTIELKLSPDQIFAVANLMEKVYETNPIDVQQKIMRSIALDVADIYIKKQHSLYKKKSLFDVKKLHKITLKFHEAYALHNVIESMLYTVSDIYCNTILKKITATLHQKLS
jgi:hypothetical protein